MDILPLSEDNYNKVAEIDRESLGEEGWSANLYHEEIYAEDKRYFVASIDGEAVAFLGYAQVLDEGHIMNIAVKSRFRRQGIASILLEKMIEDGKERGIHSFTLEVRDGNDAAIGLYEKKGFTLAGVRKKYYGGKEDARIYWLYL